MVYLHGNTSLCVCVGWASVLCVCVLSEGVCVSVCRQFLLCLLFSRLIFSRQGETG